jgi:hypothetical protein
MGHVEGDVDGGSHLLLHRHRLYEGQWRWNPVKVCLTNGGMVVQHLLYVLV